MGSEMYDPKHEKGAARHIAKFWILLCMGVIMGGMLLKGIFSKKCRRP